MTGAEHVRDEPGRLAALAAGGERHPLAARCGECLGDVVREFGVDREHLVIGPWHHLTPSIPHPVTSILLELSA